MAQQAGNEARGQARLMGERTREHAHNLFHRVKDRRPGPLRWLQIIAGGAALAAIAIASLVVLIPVFLFLSPILFPLGFLLFLGAAGFLTAAGAALATVNVISWAYTYFKGRHLPGAGNVEYACVAARYFRPREAAQREKSLVVAAPRLPDSV